MLRHLRIGLLLALVVVSSPRAPAGAQEMQFDQSTLIRRLLPTVVNITAVVPLAIPVPHAASAMGDPGMQATEQKRQLGSGFIIAPSGVIVTNYHVVDGAYEIIVTFADGTQTQAQLLEADRLSDIALLKITTPSPLPAVQWADSSTVRVGDPVLAIGNPLGVGMSVTGGIVSAVNRDIMETPYDNYIQTDAPINHGNSGGPLFDILGKVVGINTAIISPTTGSAGLGFAIPANDARFVIRQLQRYGWIRPGWMGIKVQQLTSDMAEALGMAEPRGSIVSDVTRNGPAANAGIEIGDIIVAYAGKTPPDERALLRDIVSTPPGSTVALTIRRDGRALDLHATVAEWPRMGWEKVDAPIKPTKLTHAIPPDLGIKVSALPEMQRIKLGLGPDTEGVLVTDVAPGTDAAQRGITQGDAILRVQTHAVASAADFYGAVAEARQRNRKFVLVLRLPQKQVHPGAEWAALQIAP